MCIRDRLKPKTIILAKCPNTVWVLHREKVVLGVVLSCYVVLGSRVVLSPIVLFYVVWSPIVLCCIEVYVCCIVLWCCGVVVLCVVLCCVVLRCMVWCSVCVPSVRAGGVLFKMRTQYQRVLGITLAEVPTIVLG